jgi:hypothetical protein
MRKYFYILFALILSSCATIFNKKQITTTIQLDKPCDIVINNMDTLKNHREYNFKTNRSKYPLNITILDSLKKDSLNYSIKSEYSSTILLNTFNYGIGILVDLFSQKKYAYPNFIYLKKPTKLNPINNYKNYRKTYKNDIFINLSIPLYSMFSTSDLNNNEINTENALGLNCSFDYYYLPNTFFSITLGQQNFLYGIESTYFSNTKTFNKHELEAYKPYINSEILLDAASSSFSLSHGHHFRKSYLYYGISMINSKYTKLILTNTSKLDNEYLVYYNNYNIGASIALTGDIGRHCFISFNYRPTILSLNSNYTNLFSDSYFGLDFGYKFKAHSKI